MVGIAQPACICMNWALKLSTVKSWSTTPCSFLTKPMSSSHQAILILTGTTGDLQKGASMQHWPWMSCDITFTTVPKSIDRLKPLIQGCLSWRNLLKATGGLRLLLWWHGAQWCWKQSDTLGPTKPKWKKKSWTTKNDVRANECCHGTIIVGLSDSSHCMIWRPQYLNPFEAFIRSSTRHHLQPTDSGWESATAPILVNQGYHSRGSTHNAIPCTALASSSNGVRLMLHGWHRAVENGHRLHWTKIWKPCQNLQLWGGLLTSHSN